jgi:EAL domain-containing protein (putative c-di-GMP-specific phosphodiesterase class I)
VIRHVCDYLARNQEDDEARYSVNLSGASVDDESLLDFITNILIEYDTDPSRLCFEITETEAISSLHRAIELVRELRAIGCRFSLDDFGAGFSSFSYLKNFPLDYLKIDGAFISDMLGDPVDQAMVKAINDVGHTMGIETIAEYVESAEIAELLREIGVDYAQGYWVARPERLIVEPAMHGARKEIAIGSGRFQD